MSPEVGKDIQVGGRAQTVGLILTTCNDLELAKKAHPDLLSSMPDRYPYGFFVIDAGSKDGTIEYFQERGESIYGPHMPYDEFPYPTEHLCQALNAGIKMYLGYDPETNQFNHLDYVGYIGWVHVDMEFPQRGWLEELVKVCEENPDYGKLSPDDWGTSNEERPGNSCPWIMPVKALMTLWEKDGMFFDEGYMYTQNYDDWDLNRRLINYGYKVMITPRAKMKHEGMGTRKEHTDEKYRRAAKHNKIHYVRKWGDGKCPV